MKWLTRDGRSLYLSEMSTGHIRKCMSLLRHHGYCSYAEYEAVGQGMPNRAIDEFQRELERRRLRALENNQEIDIGHP